MDRFHRIYRLHAELARARRPVSRRQLEERLECSPATVKRILLDMRDSLHAPIEYDREQNGYYYRRPVAGEPAYELPGLWFQPEELHALLAAQQLLARLQPGLFESVLAPLRGRIDEILALGSQRRDELGRRVRIFAMAARRVDAAVFGTVTEALLARRRLAIEYFGRARGTATERAVSPARLVHYRGNWYLDAWCHVVEALRIFSLDRIERAVVLPAPAREVDDEVIDSALSGSYGIFGGPATELAVLRFSAPAARWVADESWHPAQQSTWLEDGRFELQIPYGNPTELIRDILRWAPECEVVAPGVLRTAVLEALAAGLEQNRARGD